MQPFNRNPITIRLEVRNMAASKPEEEYMDILQNIEWSIVSVARAQPDLTDYQVDSALEALGRNYAREGRGGQPVLPKSELARAVYEAIHQTCEWRLGREQVVNEDGQPLSIEPVTVDVILACLKRLRKSISFWNKESGTRGYLSYIKQFLI